MSPLHLMNCPFCGEQDHLIVDICDPSLKGQNIQGSYYCKKTEKYYRIRGHIKLVESKKRFWDKLKWFWNKRKWTFMR